MSELPGGWTETTLARLMDGGLFIDGDWVETKDQDEDGEVRLTQLADIGEGCWRNRSNRSMTRESAKRLGCTYLEKGDVLVARMPDPLGRACMFPGDPRQAVTVVDVCVMRPHPDNAIPSWLMWFFNAPPMRAKIAALQSGTTRKRISRKNLGCLTIPVPPIAEQQRIVEVIEEQFSHLDAAEASLTHVEHRANALAEAAYRAVRSPRWPFVKLSTIAKTSSGGTPSRRKADNFCGTIPWIKSGELGDSHVRATAERISDTGLASSSAKLLKRGTLMMAMYGATVGKLGILDLDSAATNQAVCAIEPHDAKLTPFLWLCLRAMRRDLIESAKGGAQPNISQGMIRDLMIPMPSPDDRARLISEIARQVSACERVAAAAVKGRLQIRRLRRAILGIAFSGRLVSQRLGEDSGPPAKTVLGPARAT